MTGQGPFNTGDHMGRLDSRYPELSNTSMYGLMKLDGCVGWLDFISGLLYMDAVFPLLMGAVVVVIIW